MKREPFNKQLKNHQTNCEINAFKYEIKYNIMNCMRKMNQRDGKFNDSC